MTSFLRQLVAGPRKGHAEAGLDLCYVTDHIIATYVTTSSLYNTPSLARISISNPNKNRSGPSHTWPKRAYRNPLDQLVAFLDAKHGADWAIWEFRAEGTGYPDHLVYDRVCHYPFPDHHPPPFALMPLILASMRRWLHGGSLPGGGNDESSSTTATAASEITRDEKRVVVVHCKAGKGRSGTASVSYLIAEEGWTAEDALARFTERRMRPMFGAGVSIPSQLRWVSYVDRWTRGGKKRYVDRPIEIVEIHAWGLRNGVKVDVEGFEDDGKVIRSFHTFRKRERQIVQGDAPTDGGIADLVWEMAGYPPSSVAKAPEQAPFADATNLKNDGAKNTTDNNADEAQEPDRPESLPRPKTELITEQPKATTITPAATTPATTAAAAAAAASRSSTFSISSKGSKKNNGDADEAEPGGMAVIFRPDAPIRIPNSDVNIAVERRNRTHKTMGRLTMVSAVAHVWFNAFFEGRGAEHHAGVPDDSGVFTIEWDAMDGIRGTSKKGSRCLDKMSVVWRFADLPVDDATTTAAAATGEEAPHKIQAADWHGVDPAAAVESGAVAEKDLGLRVQSPGSADISRASSVRTADLPPKKEPKDNNDDGDRDGEDDGAVLASVKTSDAAGKELEA